MITPISKDAPS